jgi:hypothetical protein
VSRSGADEAAAPLNPRDRALLHAVGAGRCTVAPGPGGALLVDGRCCSDQFAGHRFTAAGWVRSADHPDDRGRARPLELTPAGRDALAGRAAVPASARTGPDAVDIPA